MQTTKLVYRAILMDGGTDIVECGVYNVYRYTAKVPELALGAGFWVGLTLSRAERHGVFAVL